MVFWSSASVRSARISSLLASIPAGSGSPTDYVSRIAEAEKIVAKDPKNLNAWLSLGNDYFDTEQAQKAINAYGKVLEIEPNNPNVLTDQGVMYRKVGWYDKALANFEKAQKLDPKHLQSLYNIGVVYCGRYETAGKVRADLEEVPADGPEQSDGHADQEHDAITAANSTGQQITQKSPAGRGIFFMLSNDHYEEPMNKRWELRDKVPAVPDPGIEGQQVHPLVLGILAARGLRDS